MMKSIIGGAILALTLTAQAQVVKTETRTEYTGKDQILSVSSRCTAARDETVLYRLSSDFSMTRCRQKKTFQVEVESTGQWYKWSKNVTVVPGSESYSYEVVTETKAAGRTYNPDEGWSFWDKAEVERQCNELRRAYVNQVVNLGESNCVGHAETQAD